MAAAASSTGSAPSDTLPIGNTSVPSMRSWAKTYAPHIAIAPWAKLMMPVARYTSTSPVPSPM
jgi:hypothetical protein